jgi:hypothetical protein
MKVYFISGMCVNCKVFDSIILPDGYEKHYIEWNIPEGSETIEEYAFKLAERIDQSQPFIIIGYSLGGIVMQEMNKFLRPEKNILIYQKQDRETCFVSDSQCKPHSQNYPSMFIYGE